MRRLQRYYVPSGSGVAPLSCGALYKKADVDARIEQLEAALAKALGALGDIGDGEPEWPDDPQKELDWCRNRARAADRQARDATR